MKTKTFLNISFSLQEIGYMLMIGSWLLFPIFSSGQNIGIGTDNPTEKLQVAGKIFSSEQGFMFPDGSVQTSASNAYETQDAGDARWIIIMDLVNPVILGSFSYGIYDSTVKVIDYQWGLTSVPGYGGTSGELTIKRLTIIKNIDASTNPLLQKALIGAYLPEIWLYFFRHMPGQDPVLYYWIELNELIITAFDQRMVFVGGEQYAHLDYIEFEFDEATWFYDDGIFINQVNYNAPE